MHLAFITSSNFNFIPDGEKNCLEDLFPEVTYELIVWDQVTLSKLATFDRILIRTSWDYHLKFNEFNTWLNELERNGLPVTNPVKSIRWNSTKSYLLDLFKAGLPIVPTCPGNQKSKILSDFPNCESFIMKPLVSASAYHLKKVSREEMNTMPDGEEDCIYQPFLPEIQKNGEWSLIFFNGTYSHAALKIAKAGDYRVQSDFGGSVYPESPSPDALSLAEKTVRELDLPIDYCRVDLLETASGWLIMEVELIEPELFILTDNARKNYREFIKRL